MAWQVELLNAAVLEELRALPADLQAHYLRMAELLALRGPLALREPHVKPLGRKLFEMRLHGSSGIARAIFTLCADQRVVVVHVFVKKTERIPAKVLKLVDARMRTLK